MKEKIIVARTLLATLGRMDDYIEHTTKKVDLTVIASASTTMSAEAICEKVINNLLKKDKIVDLRLRVRKLIRSLSGEHSHLLHSHYVEGKTVSAIAADKKVTERTAFRHLNKAQEEFSRGLGSIGINNFTFGDLVREYRWLREELSQQMRAV